MTTIPRNFTISKARYAKGMIAVSCQSAPDGSIFGTYEMVIARQNSQRYTLRENAHLMSKAGVRRFLRAYGTWKSEIRKRKESRS